MSYPVVTAAILIEANGAALNNAGGGVGQRLSNAVVVKQIRIGKSVYPYISGQAMRRWWREVLYADFAWQPSPVTREAKSAYTQGDPGKYPDDDVFGYMAAKKASKATKSKKGKDEPETPLTLAESDDSTVEADIATGGSGGTQKRISPLKNSLLVSVLPGVITSDFGHFSRDLPVDNADMVPFEHEHYTSLLQGTFMLSLMDVGRFECGPMRDLPMDAVASEALSVAQETDKLSKPRILALSLDERRKRIAETISALGRLRYGANLTRNLSDVVPVVVLLSVLDGGNAPFQNLFTPSTDGSRVVLNLARLESVVKDYADRLLTGGKLYFGYRPGVLANEADVLAAFETGMAGITFEVGTPGETINKVAALIKTGTIVPEKVG